MIVAVKLFVVTFLMVILGLAMLYISGSFKRYYPPDGVLKTSLIIVIPPILAVIIGLLLTL